jgi:hypothetical protein
MRRFRDQESKAVATRQTPSLWAALFHAPVNADRIESWFGICAQAAHVTTCGCREMVNKILPSEANAIIKLYPKKGIAYVNIRV